MPGVIIHEWVESAGGAERVVDEFLQAFPDADLRVLWDDAPDRFSARSIESWMAKTPLRRHKALALPFTLPTWRMMRTSTAYDWMLVSSHLFAHHARFNGMSSDIPKYTYVHSPARYIWTPELDRRGASLAVRSVAPVLKRFDRSRAHESAAIAANSEFVRQRVRDTWECDAEVIYPPVDVDRLTAEAAWSNRLSAADAAVLDALPRPFILGASRFIPYKRLDAVIEAGNRAGVPVVVAGRGPEEANLRQVATNSRVPVYFVISPSDELLYSLIQAAGAFVFPAVEDFGIIPVEAQALGTPVVTGPIGGQTESVIDGVTGVIAASADGCDLAAATEKALLLRPFDGAAHTRQFVADRFRSQIRGFVGVPSVRADA